MKQATFAAGCFWGVEHEFRQLKGVIDARSGYSGGKVKQPSYQQVCGGGTGHAEAVTVTYDPKKISYKKLVEEFFDMHDPTTVNQQGPDIGTQYRSIIFYRTAEEKKIALQVMKSRQKNYDTFIVTQLLPFEAFYEAEAYHQRYVEKHS